MQAIREIQTVHSNRISVDVPDFFKNKKIEILIFPVDPVIKENNSPDASGEFLDFVAANNFKLPVGYKFDRDKFHER